jgi:hypothetical protein
VAQQPGDDPGSRSPSRSLVAGNHQVRVEYRPSAPPSRFEVLWEPPDRGMAPIPSKLLSPAPDHMFRITSELVP